MTHFFIDVKLCNKIDKKEVQKSRRVYFQVSCEVDRVITTDGTWSASFSNLSKSGLDNYVVKCSKRPLLEDFS